jgi:hypothetical protein
VPGGALTHWPALVALGALLVNDWLVKPAALVPLQGGVVASAAAWSAGKVSDVAGLFFLAVLLAAVVELALAWTGRPWRLSSAAATGIVVAVGVAFAAMKTTDAGARTYALAGGWLWWTIRSVWSFVTLHAPPSMHPLRIVKDRSDLLALAVLVPAQRLLTRRASRRRSLSETPTLTMRG